MALSSYIASAHLRSQMLYGLPRPTLDVDCISVIPTEETAPIQSLAGADSALHKKHAVYLRYVGIVTVPENYSERLIPMSQNRLEGFNCSASKRTISRFPNWNGIQRVMRGCQAPRARGAARTGRVGKQVSHASGITWSFDRTLRTRSGMISSCACGVTCSPAIEASVQRQLHPGSGETDIAQGSSLSYKCTGSAQHRPAPCWRRQSGGGRQGPKLKTLRSPDHRDPVAGEISIACDQREFVGERLSDQNTVERIFMDFGKAGEGTNMWEAYSESGNVGAGDKLIPPGKRIRQQGSGSARFQYQFPKIGDARGKWRGCECLSRGGGEFFWL